jgi:hypothetical protein
MKLLSFVLVALMLTSAVQAEEIKQDLKSFHRIVASPHINLVLQKGSTESIRLVYDRVSADKINIEVTNKTLKIYLDDARMTEKTERVGYNQKRGIYHDVNVTAYVTYRDIDHLEIRGNQELTCLDPLKAETFTLKAYGENEITLTHIKTDYFKTSLYGENDLRIKSGKADYQKYRLFGDNKIDTRELKSYSTIANIYGESNLKLTSEDELKISAFGDPQVMYKGNAQVSRRFVFGEAKIERVD